MSVALLALGLSLVSMLCAIGSVLLARRARRESREAYVRGYGIAAAKCVGVVAAELGPGHPLVDRMVLRLGDIAP